MTAAQRYDMLGVSEGNILEHCGAGARPPPYDERASTKISFNQTDPNLIVDGINRITIVPVTDDEYLVDYWGYVAGYMRVTRVGVRELGGTLLGDPDPIPQWLITELPSDGAYPWWVPDEFDGEPTLPCDGCGTATPAGEIVTPKSPHGDSYEQYCRECWSERLDQRRPRTDNGAAPIDRADRLRHEATMSPETVVLNDVQELLQSDNEGVRVDTLHALAALTESRPADVVEFVPFLQPFLESNNPELSAVTLQCLAALGEEYPDQVTPLANDVVTHLDNTDDSAVLEAAVSFVVCVAEDDPGAVIDAVPKLAPLLQDDALCEEEAVLALTRISKGFPEAILPVVPDLLHHVEDERSSNRVSVLATIGHVAKEYPNVAESALPTLIELLDAESFYLRANAGGVLAELADEYPTEVQEAVPRVIELLDDDDEKARYNATSILARVAKAHPETVEPAIDPLIDALEEEFPYSRSNACWALGYLEATAAEPALEGLVENDPHKEVRVGADWALRQLG